jgi:opacity protein-like surface antigen
MRLAAGLLLLAIATSGRAEWFADLYGGAAYTPRSDIVLVIGSPTGPADHTFHSVKWNNSPTLGARAGYWFEAAPWYGVGLDVFRFSADVPTQMVDTTISGVSAPATLRAIDFDVTALALDLVRLRYPMGRFEPQLTAGPALFRVRATNRENGEMTTTPAVDSTWGYKLGAGLAWRMTKALALFGEYRFTHVHSEPVLEGTITNARVPMKFDLDTHHLVAGASLRW